MFCVLESTFCAVWALCGFSYFSSVQVAAWPAAHSAYYMFSWYRYLSVVLIIPNPRFMEWECLLIVPFPDHCLLVPSSVLSFISYTYSEITFHCMCFSAMGSPRPHRPRYELLHLHLELCRRLQLMICFTWFLRGFEGWKFIFHKKALYIYRSV